jgi:hypothetical protein
MRTDQLARLEALRDRLLEVAISDADPDNWTACGSKPKDMSKDERGDAKWCRSLAVSTVALTMQVQRLMLSQAAGSEVQANEEETVEAEMARYEVAATRVLARARDGKAKR